MTHVFILSEIGYNLTPLSGRATYKFRLTITVDNVLNKQETHQEMR